MTTRPTLNAHRLTKREHSAHIARGDLHTAPVALNQCNHLPAWDARGDALYGDADADKWDTEFCTRLMHACPSTEPTPQWYRLPAWADHTRRETDHDGTTLHVCHPYDLHADAWADFQALTAAGYTVKVTGASCYFPGRTIRVELHEPERTEGPRHGDGERG